MDSHLSKPQRKTNFQTDKPMHHGNKAMGTAAQNLFDIVVATDTTK